MVGAMDITINHHHYIHVVSSEGKAILTALHGITETLMSFKDDLDKVKADLTATNDSLDNIAADIVALDTKIAQLGETPGDAALLAEVVSKSAALRLKAADLAATHPDAPPVVPTT